MRTFVTRYPLLFAILATLAGVLSQLWPFWVPGLTNTPRVLLARATVLLVTVSLLATLRWWREAGFVRPTSWRAILPCLPLACIWLLPPLLNLLLAGARVTTGDLFFLGLVSYLTGGFVEEAIFRGIVLRVLLRHGLMRANLLAATIFATAHLAGLAVGADPTASAVQWVYTWFFGFAAVAVLSHTGTIWPLVILHFLANFCSYLATGDMYNTATPTLVEGLIVMALMALPAAYGLWLLRQDENTQRKRLVPVADTLAEDAGRGS